MKGYEATPWMIVIPIVSLHVWGSAGFLHNCLFLRADFFEKYFGRVRVGNKGVDQEIHLISGANTLHWFWDLTKHDQILRCSFDLLESLSIIRHNKRFTRHQKRNNTEKGDYLPGMCENNRITPLRSSFFNPFCSLESQDTADVHFLAAAFSVSDVFTSNSHRVELTGTQSERCAARIYKYRPIS